MNRTTKYTVTGMGVGLSIMGSSIAYKLLARMDIPAKPAIVRRFDDANITLARLKEMREELPYVTEDLTRDFPDVFSRDRITNLESATERVRGEINKMQGLPEITDYQEGVKKIENHNRKVDYIFNAGYFSGLIVLAASMTTELRNRRKERTKKRAAIN